LDQTIYPILIRPYVFNLGRRIFEITVTTDEKFAAMVKCRRKVYRVRQFESSHVPYLRRPDQDIPAYRQEYDHFA
jgi:hypothetical protein